MILDEVYETLKKLEQVEQFPTQPSYKDDSGSIPYIQLFVSYFSFLSVYLTNPIDDASTPTPEHDEINPYDSIVESVHSQKLTKRETPSPNLPRFTPPPQSTHRQQPIKVTQSAFVPYTRTSASYYQQTQTRSADHHPYEVEHDLDYQLQQQKVEYEAIIQRHLKFIDQVRLRISPFYVKFFLFS